VKLLQTFPGGTHNGTWTSFGYYDHINKFIAYVSPLVCSVKSGVTGFKLNDHYQLILHI